MDKKVIAVQEEIVELYKPKQIRYIQLNKEYSSDENLNQLFQLLAKAPKQSELLLAYFQLIASEKKPIASKQLIEKANSTSTVLKALIDKEIFEEYFLTHDRTDFEGTSEENELHLSEAQQEAFNKIRKHIFNRTDEASSQQ